MSAVPPAATAAELLLIRHGETPWNSEGRIQGHTDIGLSALGRRQAQALARHLAHAPIAAVYASDLERARDTAHPLAQALGLALHQDARLRERGFGIFEGSTYEEAQARWPNEYAIWRRREAGHAVPGGESYLQARARVLQFLEETTRRHGGAQVAIVTHGGVLDVVYRAAQGIAWETPRSHLLPNASINRVRARDRGPGQVPDLAVVAWAQSEHLDGALDELA